MKKIIEEQKRNACAKLKKKNVEWNASKFPFLFVFFFYFQQNVLHIIY